MFYGVKNVPAKEVDTFFVIEPTVLELQQLKDFFLWSNPLGSYTVQEEPLSINQGGQGITEGSNFRK